MARKQNPIVAVLRYFETATEVEIAQALALAKEIVRRRTPAPKKKVVRNPAVRKALQELSAESTKLPGQGEMPESERQQIQKAAATAKAPRRRKPVDVALPGMPGPVAQVGD